MKRRISLIAGLVLLLGGACSSPSGVADPEGGARATLAESVPDSQAEGQEAREDDDALFVDDGSQEEADYRYVIPFGTGEKMDDGEPVDILPSPLDVKVGEVIEIANEDDRGHVVGPFFIGEGETLRQRFSSPGEFIGLCTVHPSGELRLTVEEA